MTQGVGSGMQLPATDYCPGVTAVHVRVPAKVNLSLRVGPVRPDNFHDVTTIFHAISLTDDVTVSEGTQGSGRTLSITGSSSSGVPADDSNLAAQAARALATHAGLPDPDVVIDIVKSIPVAGGMAGGSANAAAALIACRRLWRLDVSDAALREIAAALGSDVVFALVGGTARGAGRGEMVTPVLAAGDLHWVIALSEGELSTPRVYAEWDRLVESGHVSVGGDDAPLLAALRTGEPRDIGPLLVNDLQSAALSLRPSLHAVLDMGAELGALGGIVSGSGPTCAFLASGRDAAIALAAEMAGTGVARAVRYATGPTAGARIIA